MKRKNKKHRNHLEWERAGITNRHHIVNKVKGGKRNPSNMISLDMERHNAWHFLFGNMSFEEVILLLKRTLQYQKMKEI